MNPINYQLILQDEYWNPVFLFQTLMTVRPIHVWMVEHVPMVLTLIPAPASLDTQEQTAELVR